jgi:hypothetical protein
MKVLHLHVTWEEFEKLIDPRGDTVNIRPEILRSVVSPEIAARVEAQDKTGVPTRVVPHLKYDGPRLIVEEAP